MNNNNFQVVVHERFGEMRTLFEEGCVYICGMDAAKALGYANPRRTVQQHCREAIVRRTTDSVGRQQDILFIPESDLYRLIFRSNMPAAEEFTDWVTHEVLPSIRKHGGYIAGQLKALASNFGQMSYKNFRISIDKYLATVYTSS